MRPIDELGHVDRAPCFLVMGDIRQGVAGQAFIGAPLCFVEVVNDAVMSWTISFSAACQVRPVASADSVADQLYWTSFAPSAAVCDNRAGAVARLGEVAKNYLATLLRRLFAACALSVALLLLLLLLLLQLMPLCLHWR